jgi:hypothetical protein
MHCYATGMNSHCGRYFQDLFTDFAKAPALKVLHQQAVVGIQIQQQVDLVAPHHLLHSRGAAAGRRQVHIQCVFELTQVKTSWPCQSLLSRLVTRKK